MKHVLLAITLLFSLRSVAQTLEADRLALVALYNATDGPNWTNKTGWNVPGTSGDSPCGWYGVTCSGGRVSQISLYNNNLAGTIPAEIGNLGQLRFLYLEGNSLTGSIPTEIGNLSNLQNLVLSSNNLNGDIPQQIFNLTQLTRLNLSRNQITGVIPLLIGNLVHLEDLGLSNNKLTGVIPYEIGNLTSLKWIYLYENQLTGSIPTSLGNLSSIQSIFFDNNQLSGSIPSSLGNLSSLRSLVLSNNQLTGNLPTSLGNLVSLRQLILTGNQLAGSIPTQLGNLNLLTALYLDKNQLTGDIPYELGSISSLESLNISKNKLTGSIPLTFGSLSALKLLAMEDNLISGSIPAQLGSATMLTGIYLDNNQLSGSIPSSLGNLSNLKYLNLNKNQLSGNVPTAIGYMSNLLVLGLFENQLSGIIPDLSSIPTSSAVYLAYNKFTFEGIETNISKIDYYWPQAEIPLSYAGGTLTVSAGGTATNNTYKWYRDNILVSTSTGSNALSTTTDGVYRVEVTNSIATGLILRSENYRIGPDYLEMDRLALVALYDATNGKGWTDRAGWNSPGTVGESPCGWYGVTCNNGRVQKVILFDNNLVGTLPVEIGDLTKLTDLDLGINKISGEIPGTIGNLSNAINLYFDQNQFTGSIPSQLGNLASLQILWLSQNQLTNSIPSSIGNLSNLSTLILHNNRLSGEIPALSAISTAANIQVSNNRFTFDGMETNISKLDNYSSQSKIPLSISGTIFSVNAGGTMSNNTYQWFKNGVLVQTISGNNTYPVSGYGVYQVQVKNSIATALTLISEDYNYQGSLPVTLVNFRAKKAEQGNLLEWSTTTESNNAGFKIERSADAVAFEEIGFLDGKGDSNTFESYQFADRNPLVTSYYRLRQMDYNGTISYSRIVQVQSEAAHLKAYPNPVRGTLTIESSQNNLMLQIFNLSGRPVFEKPAVILQKIDTTDWAPGNYLIKVGDKTEKIVVLN